jgi:membrane-bound lytic murein transglycosylase A
VFIESGRRGTDSVMRRLMFAQDTGGAIRGVVRGDFFWGTGPDAGREAFRTRDALSMWVLLPQGFVGTPAEKGLRTRSIGAPTEPDCTIPDEAFC